MSETKVVNQVFDYVVFDNTENDILSEGRVVAPNKDIAIFKAGIEFSSNGFELVSDLTIVVKPFC